MKLLTITGLTALVLVVAATSMPRAHPPSPSRTAEAGLPAVQEMAQQSKLPDEDFEDRSLVFPRGTER